MFSKRSIVSYIALLVLLWFVSSVFCQETTKETTLLAPTYRNFNLVQQALLAAATVFKPESAKNANVKYFHQMDLSVINFGAGDDKEIGVKLGDGKFVVIDPTIYHMTGWKADTKFWSQEVFNQAVASVGVVSAERQIKGAKKGEAILHWGYEDPVKLLALQ